jgi:hypothetical protein
MASKNRDLRDVEQRQSNVGNPKDQQNSTQDTGSSNSQNTKPPNPLLGQKPEEYLREQANIEDMPNEEDQEDYDKTIEKTKKK